MTGTPRPPLAPVRYHGEPPHTVHTITSGVWLPLVHRVRHSPTGYSWGYAGSGPADLARSLLWDALGAEPHPSLYQRYKREVVAYWDEASPWDTDRDTVRTWVLDCVQHPDADLVVVLATGAPLLREDDGAD